MNALGEESQLDHLKSFAKKYGSAIVSGILIALIAFFGWQWWQKKNLAESQTNTARVQQLMDEATTAETNPNIYQQLVATADKIVKEAPDSAQAIQTQLVMAKIAFDKADYAAAEKALKRVENSKVDDEGLVGLVKLRLGYAQLAQKKYNDALQSLSAVTLPAYKAMVEEARGDVYFAKNDIPNAKKAYLSAWNDLVEQQQDRQILQIKLQSVGVLVDDPKVERPILETQMDENE
ncbi:MULTISPECIES: YfgM family protein [unclassified Acinetobacter]|uniref:YfgM family protein n=1 Tax=unclassified Acinetobacter TaxID=196816 RepID=UPI0029342D85|nr:MULTISPECIES: tetratricopeptide repeat protein [unclassified Acinetobacter]WOE30424.1 tetratricopeptide repeat protein [Acinetobacter sp. SAAs470]WOE38615.1 tetratricopeptide repeat protein [Acinetobacter sp. SAAs474]